MVEMDKKKHWAPLELQYDSKIIKDSVVRYYLTTSLPLEPIRNASDEFKNVIALDPGIRTFLTGYDIHGKGIAFWKRRNEEHFPEALFIRQAKLYCQQERE
jgi:transposase